jgi:alpha-tubulin suppressor-like RCC1 family protein
MPAPRRNPRILLWSVVLPLAVALAGCSDQELPTAVPSPRANAALVQEGARLISVSAGEQHTCAVKSDGTLACWGDNSDGQTTAPAGTFTEVSAGAIFNCAVSTDGAVLCWGNNGSGQTDAPVGTYAQVSAGDYHACAV